jgi:peptidoglycan-N-acetylglucosamine deacetylase
MASERPTLLLSVDFEDWHQLVRRRVGVAGWETPGPALERQTDALLGILGELGVRATFFVLGIAARAHPHLLPRIVEGGHEIGCHGDAHRPVHTQRPEEFAQDLRAAKATIADLTGGLAPIGYRAPAFSITREAGWAYAVLAQEGFAYDASQHDSPAIRNHAVPATQQPHRLDAGLWEFPIAVWHPGPAAVPVGGASYWQVLPTRLILTGLGRAGRYAGLYLHPNELDPEPLRAMVPPGTNSAQRAHARLREVQRNGARRRAPSVLKAIARRFDLIPYGEAYARLGDSS